MKVGALIPLRQTAEFWDATTTQGDDGSITYHYFKAEENVPIMVIDSSNRNPTIYAEKSFNPEGQFRNIKDSQGTPIFTKNGVSYNLFLTNGLPVMNIFGAVIGYRYEITRDITLPS